MDKISLILTVYNAEKFLEKCLNSIVNQTYKNLEIIIIDDGSKDSSANIIDKYVKKYKKKIKAYHQENQGIGASRNRGISLSSGDFITFIDSDDYLELNMIEYLYENIKKYNGDIAICNFIQFDDLGNRTKIKVTTKEKIVNMNDNPQIMNKYNFAPWNKLYKKDLFTNIKFPTEYKYEDLSAIFKAFLNANRIVNVNKELYNYYVNLKGETKTINYRNFDMYFILKDIISYSNLNNRSDKFIEELKIFTVYRIYEVFGNMLNKANINSLKKYIGKSIKLLNDNFENWDKYITNNKFKNYILGKEKLIYIYIYIRRFI